MNRKILCLSIALLLMLIGCSQEKEIVKSEEASSDTAENRQDVSQRPPNLKISVDGQSFIAAMNGYQWSYFDEEENAMATIEAETVGADALLENRKAPAVSSDSIIELQFKEEPLTYQVNVFDSFYRKDQTDVVLDGQNGRTVYEVKATWEHGTGFYAFPLDIQ